MEAAIGKLRETAINVKISLRHNVVMSGLPLYEPVESRLAGDIAKVTVVSRMNGKLIQPDPMR